MNIRPELFTRFVKGLRVACAPECLATQYQTRFVLAASQSSHLSGHHHGPLSHDRDPETVPSPWPWLLLHGTPWFPNCRGDSSRRSLGIKKMNLPVCLVLATSSTSVIFLIISVFGFLLTSLLRSNSLYHNTCSSFYFQRLVLPARVALHCPQGLRQTSPSLQSFFSDTNTLRPRCSSDH